MLDEMETDRLRLRLFTSDDVQVAFNWFGYPLVMRFTPSAPDSSIEKTAARIAHFKHHQSDHDFSKWIIMERFSGRPIGDAGLLFSLPDRRSLNTVLLCLDAVSSIPALCVEPRLRTK